MNHPLNELGKEFLSTSNSKGFTSGILSYQDTVEKLMLTVSELAEALEELRAGHHPDITYYNPEKPTKPEGFPIELADAIIRLLQLAAACGIDMDGAVALKNAYNKTRPFKHGKVF
jgi:NTP pyrophosphatase (non-canonical NTP hydrolase)